MLSSGPILVPLDGSETAEGALPFAAALATALGTDVVLLTVSDGADPELIATFPEVARDVSVAATTHFEKYLTLIKDGLKVNVAATSVRSGDAADEIQKAAKDTGARAIVIATHGRSGIGRWVYGSTAGQLLRSSEVPVLAVGPNVLAKKATTVNIAHIMAPIDGSPLSERALPVSTELATKVGAKLSLVRALRWAVQAYPYTLPDAYVPQIDDELEKGAKEYLQQRKAALPDGVQADAFVVRGAIADGLIDFAEQQHVDLIVMTTHARKGLARAALGSVADRVLQGPAPVLLLREYDD